MRNNIQNMGYVVCFKFYENNYVGNNLEDLKIPTLEGHKDDMHDDANYWEEGTRTCKQIFKRKMSSP